MQLALFMRNVGPETLIKASRNKLVMATHESMPILNTPLVLNVSIASGYVRSNCERGEDLMRHFGIILIMLSAFFWAVSGGISTFLMNHGHSPFIIAFFRGFLALPFFLAWSARMPLRRVFQWNKWSWLAGAGVVGNFTFYLFSIEAAGLPIAITLMYTAPAFVLLISLLGGFEKSTLSKWLHVGAVIAGIVLLTQAYNLDNQAISLAGIVSGILSGISYTVFIFAFTLASRTNHVGVSLLHAFLVFSLLLGIAINPIEAAQSLLSVDVGWFILLGALGAGLSFSLYLYGLRRTLPTTASLVAMIEPVTASLIGIFIFNDYLNVVQAVGMVIILLAIAHYSFKSRGGEEFSTA